MNYKDLAKANETIKTTPIKGKQYAEVNQRIRAFRMLYPEGFIRTTLLSMENGVCVFKAEAGYTDVVASENGYSEFTTILGTGHAYEKEDSTFINKTSYIENCETSAVGRALGMVGIGVDTSVASFDEVKTAIVNQEEIPVLIPTEQDKDSVATTDQVKQIKDLCERDDIPASFITEKYGIDELDALTRIQAYRVVDSWHKVKRSYSKNV